MNISQRSVHSIISNEEQLSIEKIISKASKNKHENLQSSTNSVIKDSPDPNIVISINNVDNIDNINNAEIQLNKPRQAPSERAISHKSRRTQVTNDKDLSSRNNSIQAISEKTISNKEWTDRAKELLEKSIPKSNRPILSNSKYNDELAAPAKITGPGPQNKDVPETVQDNPHILNHYHKNSIQEKRTKGSHSRKNKFDRKSKSLILMDDRNHFDIDVASIYKATVISQINGIDGRENEMEITFRDTVGSPKNTFDDTKYRNALNSTKSRRIEALISNRKNEMNSIEKKSQTDSKKILEVSKSKIEDLQKSMEQYISNNYESPKNLLETDSMLKDTETSRKIIHEKVENPLPVPANITEPCPQNVYTTHKNKKQYDLNHQHTNLIQSSQSPKTPLSFSEKKIETKKDDPKNEINNIDSSNEKSIMDKTADFDEKEELSEIIEALKKPFDGRREADYKLLQKFTIRLDFFQKLDKKSSNGPNNTHKECCKVMNLQEFEKDQMIIKHGDEPECFYVILSGDCLVLVPKPDSFRIACKHAISHIQTLCSTVHNHMDTPNINQELMTKIVNEQPEDFQEYADAFLAMEDNKIVYKPEYLKIALGGIEINESAKNEYFNAKTGVITYFSVASLPSGKVFGEMGLLQNKPRAATIIAKNSVSQALINKVDYHKILMSLDRYKLDKKINFLEDKVFKFGLYCDFRKRLPFFFTKVKMTTGMHIYKQGDLDRSLYIIKRGECLIYKNVPKPKNVIGTYNKTVAKNESQLRKDFTKKEKIHISRIGEGEYFGECEFVNDLMSRQYSVVCTSKNGVLFKLAEADFLMFCQKIPHFEKMIIEKLEEREKTRQETVEKNAKQLFTDGFEKYEQKKLEYYLSNIFPKKEDFKQQKKFLTKEMMTAPVEESEDKNLSNNMKQNLLFKIFFEIFYF